MSPARGHVTRCFQRYTSEQRADLAASHLTSARRQRVGEYYYVSDVVPGVAFETRGRAEAATMAALARAQKEAE